ncbi:phage tail tape measure protein [Streptomyces sp. LS1784]|uniref:phage tail tape measure protein n=1 Tax=Streptomyces sp. LS1784 TaxID=2851533 RepID=UPI001CC95CAD|nr:phage tail tape measure protein [Streptomyces sp. LS1784]
MALTVGELTGYADLDDSRFTSGVQRVGRGMETLASEVEQDAAQAGQAGGEALGEGLATEAEQGAEKAGSRIGTALKAVAVTAAAAGLAAGAALIKGVTGAMEQEKVAGKLGAQLGATPEVARQYGQIAGRMYADAVTEDVQGAADAVRSTMSAGLLPPGATNDQIQQIATRVHDLADTFELDLGQSANAAGQMIKTGLAKDGAEALDVMTRGMQVMGPRADDLADTFNEYSTIFRQMGLSATQATGLLAQGMAAGARDTDVVADSLKELVLITQGGGDAVNEAFAKIGLSGSAMQKAFVEGGPAAAQGLDTLLDRLRAMKDPVERQSVALTLFGTKSEDVQRALYALDPSSATAALGDVGGAAQRMGDSLRDNASTRIEQFKRSIEQGLTEVVGGRVLPVLERVIGVVESQFGPAFSAASSWITGTAVPAVVSFGRALIETVVPAVTRIGSELADRFGPVAAKAGQVLRDDLAPAVTKLGRFLRDDVVPPVKDAVRWLGEHLVPAAATVAGVLVGTVIPALADTARWLSDNRTTIAVVAGAITAVLLPVLITTAVGYAQAGIAATISAAQQVAAWATSGGAAVTNGAMSVVASYQTVGGWIAAGASAVASGAQQVWAWVTSGAAAIASGAQQAAAWITIGARIVWGMALQAAAVVEIVAGWVMMGAQSMLQAARMAAAWVLAMGPLGWVIAAVVAVVALVIANWDTVRNATVAAWNWISNLVVNVANSIRNFFSGWDIAGVLSRIWGSVYDGAVNGWNATVNWIKGVPGWIKSALGDLGGLLVSAGGDVVRGLWAGISSMGSWLKGQLINFAKSAIPGPIRDALGIASPSRVMAEQVGRWIPAGIVSGIQAGTGELDATMRSLVQPPPVPAMAGAAVGSAGYGTAAGGGGFHITNYYESDSGSAAATAEDLLWLSKGRG